LEESKKFNEEYDAIVHISDERFEGKIENEGIFDQY